jgi:presequence protease
VNSNFTVGSRLGGYTVLRVLPLKQVAGQFIELRHDATLARHIHIACQDDNNAFTVTFPTIPDDDTGIAHILEHIVLAGSERYPVHDPFFSMTARSLSTFMNAFTSNDWTSYPFSTRNKKDFYNLLEVYLDATFFPRIAEDSYKQEGWRFEFETMSDPSTPLEYKGVVYNEMKGAMASPRSVLSEVVNKGIFPDLTYANNSGGDPKHIPELTHQQLKDFHASHYHPSNAYFVTYGSFDLEPTLAMIEQNALGRFQKLSKNWSIPDQPRFDTPKRVEGVYAVTANEPLEKKAQVVVSFLTTFVGNSLEKLALSILNRVLMANANSRLRQALIESGLGSALSDVSGFSDNSREALFNAGLKDVREADAEKIEKLVLETLQNIVNEGIDEDSVNAAIHRFEIESKEVSNAQFPFALKVIFAMVSAFVYGGDPYSQLQFDSDLEKLQAARKQGRYFEGLIEKYFLNNPHRTLNVLKPDSDLQSRLEAEERATLEEVKANLTPTQVEKIVADAARLEATQNQVQDLSSLPTLALSDIPMDFEQVEGSLETVLDATLGLYAQPTNGLSYVDIQANFSMLSVDHKALLPVLAFVLPRLGGGSSTYLQMAARIEGNTGGITANASTRTNPNDNSSLTQGFTISGKALNRNLDGLFSIFGDLLNKTEYDQSHLKNLLGQYRGLLEARLVDAGSMYANYLAEAQLSQQGALSEAMNGVSQVRLAKRLASLEPAALESLIKDFQTIQKNLFCQSNLKICVTAEPDQLEQLKSRVKTLLEVFPDQTPNGLPSEIKTLERQPIARSVAAPVAFNTMMFKTVPFTHPDAAPLCVLADYLRSKYTHKEIREKGGAYGGWAAANQERGTFFFGSYRDPHIKRSFDVFQEAANWVLGNVIDTEGLKEAILTSCSDVDPLLSSDTKGRSRFFGDANGYTISIKKEFKKRLLETTASDLQRVAKQYLQDGVMAIIAGEEKIALENPEMGNVFEVEAV